MAASRRPGRLRFYPARESRVTQRSEKGAIIRALSVPGAYPARRAPVKLA
jgi:hypothetical protein